MKKIIYEIWLAVVIIITAIVITVSTGVPSQWILIPVLVAGLCGLIAYLFRQSRLKKSFGIPTFLLMVFLVSVGWYLFCVNMPITSAVIESQKEAKDFDSFKNFKEGTKGDKNFLAFQLRQDSIYDAGVAQLLSVGKDDEALTFRKEHKAKFRKLVEGLFPEQLAQLDKKENINHKSGVEMISKNEAIVYFAPDDALNTRLYVEAGDTYTFSEVEGEFWVKGHEDPRYCLSQSEPFTAKSSGYIWIHGNSWGKVKVTTEKS